MNAWIFPRNNSYFAISTADGKFTIPDLPAGVPLTFKVWQAKAGFLKKVKINGEEKAIPSKGLPFEIPKDGELTLDVELDPAPLL